MSENERLTSSRVVKTANVICVDRSASVAPWWMTRVFWFSTLFSSNRLLVVGVALSPLALRSDAPSSWRRFLHRGLKLMRLILGISCERR